MNNKQLYIETYGCQMNFNDSEVVASILSKEGFNITENIDEAGLILLNTCSIRENAENKVFQRLNVVKKLRKENDKILIGVIGCMAERLRDQLLEKAIDCDIVAGPDSYKNLPNLYKRAALSKKAIDVVLSKTETYSDVSPHRIGNNKLSAFVSIMRGCDNFCTYCIVPFTRGRERSRDAKSILKEVQDLIDKGYKEVTILGQNVNSYKYVGDDETVTFTDLMERVALLSPDVRVRFTTSHPKDLGDDLLEVIAKYPNICKSIHLPVQSGSTRVLEVMGRTYSREWFMNRVDAIKKILPESTISTDILSGFCTETEEDHKETLSIMEYAKFDMAFMFKYSERPGTKAAKELKDDVDEETKAKRLNEIIALQNKISRESNQKDVGKTYEVLVEGPSKRSDDELCGRTSQNKMVVFPKENYKPGEYVLVKIDDFTSATLLGKAVGYSESH